jgi:O-acetyl-ADP-ribose deacetylase (regulator of RNase III)
VSNTRIRLERGDITDQELEAFVYYAQHDLKLGSGFGTAIAGRGGVVIQKELDPQAPVETCDAVISSAGAMKAGKIIHAVGPRFQEPDMEGKLRRTMENVLALADSQGIRQLAFPPMGAGFYGVPLDMCAKVMVETITRHLEAGSGLEDVIVYAGDKREHKPFAALLEAVPA